MASSQSTTFRLALASDNVDGLPFDSGDKSKLENMWSEFMDEVTGNGDPAVASAESSDTMTSNDVKSDVPEQTTLPQTLFAKVVFAFSYTDSGQSQSHGRVGLAVVQHSSTHRHVILYRTKLDVLSTCTLPPTATEKAPITFSGEYAQFRDDMQRCWSASFLNPADRELFVQQVEMGNPDRPVNPSTEATSTDRLPEPNSNPVASPQETPSTKRPTADKSSLVSRMARVGQQLPQMGSAPTAARQPTTPFSPATSSSSTASDDSDSHQRQQTVVVAAVGHQTRSHSYKPAIAHRPPALSLSANTLIAYNAGGGGGGVVGHPPQSSAVVGLDSQALHAHFAESRMQSTELRMNMSKLEQRLDRVLDRIDATRPAGRHSSQFDDTSDAESQLLAMEERQLALRKENLELRRQLKELKSTVGGQSDDRPDLETERARTAQLRAANEALALEMDKLRVSHAEQLRQTSDELTSVRTRELGDLSAKREADIAEFQVKLAEAEEQLKAARASNNQKPSASAADVTSTVKTALVEFYDGFKLALDMHNDDHEVLDADVVCRYARGVMRKVVQDMADKDV